MEFDKLKSSWKSTIGTKKNQDELLMMSKIKSNPKIKRIRIKFLIESILLVTFTALYYNGFDGDTKPLWANVLLISTASFYIILRFVGWLVLINPIKGNNLKKSLLNFEKNLKQIAFSILLTSFVFGLALVAFFISSIEFTTKKYGILSVLLITFLIVVYISNRNWIQRIKNISTKLKEFDVTIE